MNERRDDDPWLGRLSEHLDGELEEHEARLLRGHLAGCAACRAELAALSELAAAARALPDRAPARDLWPGIEGRLSARPRGRSPVLVALVAAAAAVLLTLAVERLPFGAGAGATGGGGERYLFLLHESADVAASVDPDELEQVVERYRAWSRRWGTRGNVEEGEKLADGEGYVLRPGDRLETIDRPGGIAGFFVIRAESYERALDIARSNPHLDLGGWIEVRRIEDTGS